MTTYNYYSGMQELCFRAVMALSVIGDDGMKDFYFAANEGFYNQLNSIPVDKAQEHINQSQIEHYLVTQDFVEEKERKAAEIMREQTEAAECQKKEA